MGFFAGVALVVLMAFVGRQRDQVSMRKLMALVAVVGVLMWFFARILSEVVGYEGF